MKFDDLAAAIKRINDKPAVNDPRGLTYLWTYPSIRALTENRSQIDMCVFHQLASSTYGWMPRVIRIDPQYAESALEAVNQALEVQIDSFFDLDAVMPIANYLHSLVGASKVLHFVNPQVFPIWDSRIEGFRLGKKPSQYHMSKPENLSSYIHNVHEIIQDRRFPDFFHEFQSAFEQRLGDCQISPYKVSEVRAVEYSLLVLTEK